METRDSALSLTLNARELRDLTHVSRVLSSPLDYSDLDRWRTTARHAVQSLLTADRSLLMMAAPQHTLLSYEPEYASAVRTYEEKYAHPATVIHRRRLELGLDVFHAHRQILDFAEFSRTEMYNEWAIPWRMLDPVMMETRVSPLSRAAALAVYYDRIDTTDYRRREIEIFRLLHPAFVSGIRTAVEFAQQWTIVGETLDAVSEGILLLDRSGSTVHRNAALGRMLAMAAVESTLNNAIEATRRALLLAIGDGQLDRLRSIARDVSTPLGLYRVQGGVVREALFGGRVRFLIVVHDETVRVPSQADLADRFGLTPTQARVAQLVARGIPHHDIAAQLGQSRHTVRTHLERIRVKCGAHSRAEIVARVLGTAEAVRA